MYAIVEIAGQQFKVKKDQKIYVHRLNGNEGDKVSFDQVLLIEKDGKISIGSPAIKEASITGKIMEHVQGDKVIVFKKKRRKGYQKRNGHRQDFTLIHIESIAEKGGPKSQKAVKEAEVKPKAAAQDTRARAESEVSTAKKVETKMKAGETGVKKTGVEKTKEVKARAAKKSTEAKPKGSAKKATAKKPASKTAKKKAPAKKATPKKKSTKK